MSGVDDSPYFLKPLLSALGVSRRKPTLQNYQLADEDPMGESLFKQDKDDPLKEEEGVEGGGVADRGAPSSDCHKISRSCDEVMSQVQRLRTVEERACALWRLTTGVQVLVARHVALMLVAHMSVQTSKTAVATLRNLELLDIQSLVRLLRLVGARRISNVSGGSFAVSLPSSLHPLQALQCLSSAISSVVTDEGPAPRGIPAGLQLMQSCSRDLLTAAVGGADLIQQVGRKWQARRRLADRDREEKSDVSVLANPNFKVSQRLVGILAKSAGRLLGSQLIGGVVQMMDALTACLFSIKLEARHRFWAMQQLVKVFGATGAGEVMRREQLAGQEINGESGAWVVQWWCKLLCYSRCSIRT